MPLLRSSKVARGSQVTDDDTQSDIVARDECDERADINARGESSEPPAATERNECSEHEKRRKSDRLSQSCTSEAAAHFEAATRVFVYNMKTKSWQSGLVKRVVFFWCSSWKTSSLWATLGANASNEQRAYVIVRRGMAAEARPQSACLCCGAEWGHSRPYARRSAGAQSRGIACPLSEHSSTGAGGAAGGQRSKDVSPAPPPENPRAVCPRTASAPASACPCCCCFPQPRFFTTPLLLAPLLLPFPPLMRPCCIGC